MLGSKKADCPFWRGPCKEHECRFYINVQGKNPNTGQDVNQWDCAVAWIPLLLIENSQQQRQTGAAVESFRNEMVEMNKINLVLNKQPQGKPLEWQDKTDKP